MKNYIWIYLTVLLSIFTSCEKDNMQYIGPDGVYFGVRDFGNSVDSLGPFQPSSRVDFMLKNTIQYSYKVPILLAGSIKNYDRQFKVSVDADSSSLESGKHYTELKDSYILPAGAHQTWVSIDFFATQDLELSEKRLVLKIIETSDLIPAFTMWDPPIDIGGIKPAEKMDASRHTIFVSNMMIPPVNWLGGVLTNGEEQGDLGVFTRLKMEFITENLGISYSEFMDEEKMSFLRLILIGQEMSRILVKRFNEGNPVIEEDGRLMYAGNVPWKSFIGIPYRP